MKTKMIVSGFILYLTSALLLAQESSFKVVARIDGNFFDAALHPSLDHIATEFHHPTDITRTSTTVQDRTGKKIWSTEFSREALLGYSPNGKNLIFVHAGDGLTDKRSYHLHDSETGQLASKILAGSTVPLFRVSPSGGQYAQFNWLPTFKGMLDTCLMGNPGSQTWSTTVENLYDLHWFSPSNRLASVDINGAVNVWDRRAKQPCWTKTHPNATHVTVSTDGRYVASASGKAVRVWDAVTGALHREFSLNDGADASADFLGFTPTGNLYFIRSFYRLNENLVTGPNSDNSNRLTKEGKTEQKPPEIFPYHPREHSRDGFYSWEVSTGKPLHQDELLRDGPTCDVQVTEQGVFILRLENQSACVRQVPLR